MKFFTTQWGFEAIDDVLARHMRVSSVVGVKLRLACQTRVTPNQVCWVIRFSRVRKDVELLLLLSLLATV